MLEALKATVKGIALGIQNTAQDVVTDTWKVFHSATAHQHDAVLLEVVALPRDVRRHLAPVAQAHAGDLAKRRVRLFRCRGVDADAHTPLLRAALERRRVRFGFDLFPSLADELVDRWHNYPKKRAIPRARATSPRVEGSEG